MRAHIFAGKQYHNLVKLAARRADIVVFNRLRHINNPELIFKLDTVGIEQRQNKIQAQRSRPAHSAAGNVSINDSINPLHQFQTFSPQNILDPVGKTPPCIGDRCRFRFGNIPKLKFNHTIIRKISAE